MEVTLTMKKFEDKKHSVRYNAVGENPAITSLYLMRVAFNGKAPETLVVTIKGE